MNLQDAVNQYADMVALGSEAIQRLIDQNSERPQRVELSDLIAEIIDMVERLKALAYDVC